MPGAEAKMLDEVNPIALEATIGEIISDITTVSSAMTPDLTILFQDTLI